MESEPMLTPREKSPLPEKFSSAEDWTHDAASSRTVSSTHYQPANPAPIIKVSENGTPKQNVSLPETVKSQWNSGSCWMTCTPELTLLAAVYQIFEIFLNIPHSWCTKSQTRGPYKKIEHILSSFTLKESQALTDHVQQKQASQQTEVSSTHTSILYMKLKLRSSWWLLNL